MRINAWGKSGVRSFIGPIVDEETYSHILKPLERTIKFSSLRDAPVFSSDGKFGAYIRGTGAQIEIVDESSDTLVGEIPCTDSQSIEFSPRGDYLVTWSRPNKGTAEGSIDGNLKVWNTTSATVVLSFSQKVMKKDVIQWSSDGRYMFHMVSNEVHIFNASTLESGIVAKIIHKGFSAYKVSPTTIDSVSSVNIGVFNPEVGGKPARATIFTFKSSLGEVHGPLNSRTMFAATDANLLWSSTGESLLVHTHADVDSGGTSYYGATGLFILTADGQVSAMVPQSKDGPVYDVKWAPDGQKFIVCAGNMPSNTTIYSSKGELQFECGAAHRNAISWSPHGRFLCVAGFGNLAGEMDFYDTVKMKRIGTNSAHCTVSHSWSPDSRYFLTAVVAPRMNVDNCFKGQYNGVGPVAMQQWPDTEDSLYYAYWHPQLTELFPNRGQSPKRAVPGLEGTFDGVGGVGASQVTATSVVVKANAVPYRPPGSTGALSELLRRESGNTQRAPVKIKSVSEVASKSNQKKPSSQIPPRAADAKRIPGMPPTQKSSQIIKSNAEKKSTTEKPSFATNIITTSTPTLVQSIQASPNPVALAPGANESPSVTSKIKALKKRLKQIEEIREKLATSSTFTPNSDQLAKLQSAETLRNELAELEALLEGTDS